MEIEPLKDRIVRERLDRELGNRPEVAEIKRALFLAQTGKLTEEMIEKYRQQKEAEYAEICKQMDEVNPSYAFDYPKQPETISKDNLNND